MNGELPPLKTKNEEEEGRSARKRPQNGRENLKKRMINIIADMTYQIAEHIHAL